MSGPAPGSGLARRAARALLAAEPLPGDVVAAARLHLLDSLGVALAAAVCGPVRNLVPMSGRLGGPGPSTVVGWPVGVDPATAALVNGALIHSLEYDDTHAASIVHGSSVLTPVALAVAEECGAAFEELLRAYVLGWELAIRIGSAAAVAIQRRGFQVSSVLGPLAAATVAGLIRGVDEDGLTRALGVAASQPAGSFSFLESAAYTKSMQPGWAAHSGVLADALARAGVTAAEHTLDGPYGVLRLYTDLVDAELGQAGAAVAGGLDSLGHRWLLPEAAFKFSPCCHYIHPYIDAVRSLVDAGATAERIARVVAHVPVEVAPVIAEPWAERQQPGSAHEGRWSLPYVIGLAFVHGEVELAHFDGSLDAAALSTAARCELRLWAGSGFPGRFPAWLEVTTTDGQSHDVRIDDVLGGPGRPVAVADVVAKFRRTAALALSPAEVVCLEELLLRDPAPDLAAIARSLRGTRLPRGEHRR